MKKEPKKENKIKIKNTSKIKQSPYLFILAFVTFILSLSLTAIIALNISIATLETITGNLATEERRYNYPMINEKAEGLIDVGQKFSMMSISEKEAISNVLKKADKINKLYGATLVQENLKFDRDKNMLSIGMAMTYYPKSPEDFLSTIQYLSSSSLPMIYIQDVIFESSEKEKGSYQVYMNLLLMHPYNPATNDQSISKENGGFDE